MKELFESSYLSVMSNENMKLREELQRKDNIINQLEEKLIGVCETCYEDKEIARIKKWIDKIKKLEGKYE